jgi:hypothetical protein
MSMILLSRRSFCQRLAVAAAASAALRPWMSGAEPVPTAPLRKAMNQAAKCCLAWLNPDQQYLPTGGYDLGHDTGRWWDAMLRYEAATGTPIPETAEAAMLKNVRTLSDNSAALLASTSCQPHNLRESLLAYTAFVRYRKNEWAREQGHTLIETIHALLEADGQLNYAQLAERTGKPLTKDPLSSQRAPAGEWFNATATTGRALEAIVWFHEATGDPLALDLAGRLAATHLRQDIDPSGRVRAELLDPARVGHTHSYCGTLRGLLLYGFASGDKTYVDAVANTYRHGLWGTSISHSGWTPHDQGKMRFPDKEGDPVGEHASCGDIAQIALWLALRAGQVDLLDDVERLLRARLFPSQIADEKNPRRDGAWGVYNHPFGYGAILDVFAAVLHSLADFDQHIVTTAEDGALSVNLHLDTDRPDVTIRSQRDRDAALLVTLKKPGDVRIRVPAWAPRESVRLSIEEKPLTPRWDGSSVVVVSKADAAAGDTIILRHALPERETVEWMPVSHRQFHLTWRGDEVLACDPKVPIYPARVSR